MTAANDGRFVVGQLVLLTRAARDFEGDWAMVWVGGMNRNVGQIGQIGSIELGSGGLRVSFRDGPGGCLYPAFVLEAVSAGPVAREEWR